MTNLSLSIHDGILSESNPNIQKIFIELDKMKESVLTIGNHLSYLELDIKTLNKSYSIVDLALSIFGFKKTSTYNYLNIYKKFGHDKEYLSYTYSQLVEMSSMSDEQLLLVDEKMKRSDLRLLKKEKNKLSSALESAGSKPLVKTVDVSLDESYLQLVEENQALKKSNYDYTERLKNLVCNDNLISDNYYKSIDDIAYVRNLLNENYKQSYIKSVNDPNDQYLKGEFASYEFMLGSFSALIKPILDQFVDLVVECDLEPLQTEYVPFNFIKFKSDIMKEVEKND